MQPDADQKARVQVAAAGGQLIRTTLNIFQEKEGSAGYRRFREQLLREITSAGADFAAAALYTGNIPPPKDYDNALILDDSAAGAPAEPLYHIRQRAMLALLKSGLEPEGESMRLINGCLLFGGRLGDQADPPGPPQALMLLDERWRAAVSERSLRRLWESSRSIVALCRARGG